ncbi:MAG: hypothetical protein PHD97_03945 [Bacteroidales bacterium]|nr:hypothetical protein [Bacteroidales bacterium]
MSSCKKDYPKDIPEWLKEKIKGCNKNKNCCYLDKGLKIDEWELNGTIIYSYVGGYPDDYSFYDFSGKLICEIYNPINLIQNDTIVCSTYVCAYINGFKHKRKIWQAECHN